MLGRLEWDDFLNDLGEWENFPNFQGLRVEGGDGACNMQKSVKKIGDKYLTIHKNS